MAGIDFVEMDDARESKEEHNDQRDCLEYNRPVSCEQSAFTLFFS
ncbi:hypothetical protein [Desulfofundulus sp.]